MTTPTPDDLAVYRRDPQTLEVFSHLTRGRCATVIFVKFSSHPSILPFLIPSYMQGITVDLIREAVQHFLQREAATVPA
ncbi:hypothetical protein BL241_03575 [Ralstonia solanacearum]|uniref:Uncharacterized protein n=1 Tax=Ralstonia solanacearum TaxID=305 RepID=A0A0S4U5N5_RALSL|nr:hypothetical protein [Ralstonia solanacearum]NKG09649.1 hypothetical protein [Ralstonia solanacearum]OIT13618.1 hypothetical protein BL241_03575 [Ralstonia solanacearum]CUV17009.1 conserved protein of unknown function [Ralstonia solanacearum]